MINRLEKMMFDAAKQSDFPRFKAFVYGRAGTKGAWACDLMVSDDGKNLFEVVIDKEPKFLYALWDACLQRYPRFTKKSAWRVLRKAVQSNNIPLTAFLMQRNVHRAGDNVFQNKDRYKYLLETAILINSSEMLDCLIKNDTFVYPPVDTKTAMQNPEVLLSKLLEPYDQAILKEPEQYTLPVIQNKTELTASLSNVFDVVKVGEQPMDCVCRHEPKIRV